LSPPKFSSIIGPVPKKKDLKPLAPEKVSEELQMRDAKAGRF
jgi:hypothetical protein